MTRLPKPGDWVRWLTEDIGREGEVIATPWPSLIVKWLGVEQPQVFPLGISYFERPHMGMSIISKPNALPEDRQQGDHAAISVRDAAAALETTPKAIRVKLRSGKLKGLKRDGRWVGVYL